MVFWLKDFPLPPTVNKSLMPIAGKLRFNAKGKPYRVGRMVKTHSARSFTNDAMVWAARRQKSVMEMRNCIIKLKTEVEKRGEKFALQIDCYFAFSSQQMWSEQSAPDTDNRLKPCLDALKKILDVDDVYFFASLCEKVSTASKDSECTVIRISQKRPRSLEEIKDLMNREASTEDS